MISFQVFSFRELFKQYTRKTLGANVINLVFGVDITNSVSDNFFLNAYMGNINALCSKNRFDDRCQSSLHVFGISQVFNLKIRLQQISKSLVGKLFRHNQDVINIDEKQKLIFNQQAWFLRADLELNGFQAI
jgi:hypothetical protein